MFDISKVEIEKEHQVLMVDKTTSFEKGKGKKGNLMISKPFASRVKKPKVKTQTRD